MSSNPTTFHGEGADKGIDWDDGAELHKGESAGVLEPFTSVRSGTFAELISFVTRLPIEEQDFYAIQKNGDRRFEIGEIRDLARRDDFPG